MVGRDDNEDEGKKEEGDKEGRREPQRRIRSGAEEEVASSQDRARPWRDPTNGQRIGRF
jgi:hypothetical protein